MPSVFTSDGNSFITVAYLISLLNKTTFLENSNNKAKKVLSKLISSENNGLCRR